MVLIDLMLPQVSGWELLEHLRADGELRHIPRIVITAVPRDQVRVVADAIFSKPLDYTKLMSAIDDLMAKRHDKIAPPVSD